MGWGSVFSILFWANYADFGGIAVWIHVYWITFSQNVLANLSSYFGS